MADPFLRQAAESVWVSSALVRETARNLDEWALAEVAGKAAGMRRQLRLLDIALDELRHKLDAIESEGLWE